jgi:hypothetical protein
MALGLFGFFSIIAVVTWRRRMAAQQLVLPVPIAIENSLIGNNCFYVTTTFSDRPLERVIAHGLAHRGHARLAITATGLEVSRIGEQSFRIPKRDLVEVSMGSAVIDRVVENNGLVVIKWRLGQVELQSHFRFVDNDHRSKTLDSLRPLVEA